MINVYDSKTIDFSNNGLVVLSDCMVALVPEELNGTFELEIEYPLDTRGKWKNLLEGNIIKADGQLFRIYRKIKNLKTIKVNARHIFYDLLDNFLEDVRLTNLSGAAALDYVLTNTQYPHNFTSVSDIGGANTKYYVRKNPVEAIMGSDGIIANWGGELIRDNFNIKLLGARGLDRGVLVAYGKNIQGIEEALDLDGLCTRLMPVGKDGLLLAEKYIDSQYINNFSHPKVKVIELNECETEETLRAAGQAYMLNSKCDIPQFNYKIDFLELSKTEEYKKYAVLERVYMGDTVTIKHSKLNINLKAKVIKITKNVLTGRIEKIELGSFKPNIATAINNSINAVKQEIVQVRSDYQKAIDNATQLITGSKGGNVVIRQDEDGKPYEILIMDTADVNTAQNVWRWNLGGFGHSDTGINGPYSTAITQDGHIVGSFITALTINASQIIGGTISGDMITGGTILGASIKQTLGSIVLNEFGKNANGGTLDIYDIYGNLNAHIGAESGAGANIGGTIKLFNDNLYLPRVELGISKVYDAGIINLKGSNGVARVAMYAESNLGAGLFVLDSNGSAKSYLRENSGAINNEEIATRNWVEGKGYITSVPPSVTQYDIDVAIFLHEQAYHA